MVRDGVDPDEALAEVVGVLPAPNVNPALATGLRRLGRS